MQRLSCILKILFNNDELTLRAKKSTHSIIKWGIRIYCQARILALCSHIEKVRESMFKIASPVFKSMFRML